MGTLHPDYRDHETIPVSDASSIQEALDLTQPGRTIEKINAETVIALASAADKTLDAAGIPSSARNGASIRAILRPIDFGEVRMRNSFCAMIVCLVRTKYSWELSSLIATHHSSREGSVKILMTDKQKLIAFRHSMKVLNINRQDARAILEDLIK